MVEPQQAYKQENKNWAILKIFPKLQHSGSVGSRNFELIEPYSSNYEADLCLTQHGKTLPEAVGEDRFHNQYPREQVHKKALVSILAQRPARDKWTALPWERDRLFITVSPGANV